MPNIDAAAVWESALELGARYAPAGFDVPLGDHDSIFLALARDYGLTPGDTDFTAWMDPADREPPAPLAEGFAIVDRTQRADQPHPMAARNGEAIAERLAQVSLYDPSLDLAAETADGTNAAYSLYWFDPVTRVGMVEPVRTQDDYQRRGLARALLGVGLHRLVARGAERLKISYETEVAGALYHKVGFRTQFTTTWYRWEPNR